MKAQETWQDIYNDLTQNGDGGIDVVDLIKGGGMLAIPTLEASSVSAVFVNFYR